MQNKFGFIPQKTEGIFFSGVLGSSLSSLALISRLKGYRVSGCDSGENAEMKRRLEKNGISVYGSHYAEAAEGYDALVYSSAVPTDSPELKYARENDMKVFSRSEFLGGMISEYPERLGVSGTHGKSTVSGMLTDIFLAEGRDITSVIGAESVSLDGAFRLGGGDTVIYEACEYKRAFLDLPPSLAVVLNIEREHVDCYPTLSDAVKAYGEFVGGADRCVLNFDDEGCRMLSGAVAEKEVLYFSLLRGGEPLSGSSAPARESASRGCADSRTYVDLKGKNYARHRADVYAENICSRGGFYSFDVCFVGNFLFSVRLSVPGIHNVKNALAATAAAILSGVSGEGIKRGLENFRGMKRRFEYIGKCGCADVYDDYAHHPTEIRAMMSTARQLGYKKIICAFQSHTYSRTAAFSDEFCKAFEGAGEVIFTDIFAAREKNIYGISGKALADGTEGGVYIPDLGELRDYLKQRAEEGTAIITVGAGRLGEVARALTVKN